MKFTCDSNNHYETEMGCANVVIYKVFCLDVAHDQMNGVPDETQIHCCRFANQAC